MPVVPLPDFTDPAVRAQVVQAARRPVHPAVLEAIVVSTPAQARSLEALKTGVCVVTGQQAGLFGGPLYTLHKATAAIVNARALEAETGVPCAPVFWLQDEDHDFDEIRTVHAISHDGELVKLSVDGVAGQEGCSVAFRQLGPSVQAALDGLDDALLGWPHAEEVMALLRESHGPELTPGAAFVAGIERLFASHGLLVVDPMHPALVEAARPLHQRAITEAARFAAVLKAQRDALEEAGSPCPVHVRDGPLNFLHPDGLEGPRVRIEHAGDGFVVVGTGEQLSREDVLAGAHTTSALLRPILQDTLLPTAVYVGGPGELRYLAQLPPLWTAFDLPVPLVVPRARFVLLEAGAVRGLRQLGLSLEQLSAPRETLLGQLQVDCGERPDPDALHASVLDEALAALEAFSEHAEALGLSKPLAKTQRSLTRNVGKLVERYRRTLALQDGVTCGRLDRLLNRLQPLGVPQERVHPWPCYAAQVGIDPLVTAILEAARPFEGTLVEVEL